MSYSEELPAWSLWILIQIWRLSFSASYIVVETSDNLAAVIRVLF